MKYTVFHLLAVSLLLACANRPLHAQVVEPLDESRSETLNYVNTPLQNLLDNYATYSGKVMIQAPSVTPITANLISDEPVSRRDHMLAIEAILSLNNLALVPFQDRFLKVVSAETAQKERPEVRLPDAEGELKDTDNLISAVVELKYLDLAEVQTLITELLHPYAKIQPLERANAMLITDAAGNIKRVQEMLKYIDQPIPAREEVRIYQLNHAQASDIASRLNELIQESQEQEAQRRNTLQQGRNRNQPATRTPANAGNARAVPNIIRATPPAPNAAAGGNPSFEVGAASERGLVQGRVQIVADERTNILIIITRPENFTFFDDMIEVLDRQVEPEITVEVFRLEFSDATEVSDLLNELIGAAAQDRDQAAGGANANTANNATDSGRRAQTIQDFIRNRNQNANNVNRTNANAVSDAVGGIGAISERTRILADERTNSLILMGKKEDIVVLRSVVDELDVMLAQVLIEAVILEVNLTDNLEYGIDWLQRSLTVVRQETAGPNGGLVLSEPVAAFGGGTSLGSGAIQDGSLVDRATALNPGALTYFGTFFDLNLDTVISAAAGSGDARVLSTPVVLTTDNTEANIVVGERRPIPTTSSTTTAGTIRSTFEYENIGIELTVTPRINPQKVVVMEVEQSADNVGGTVVIDGNEVPIITTRQLSASITVENRTTVVLGGLVSEDQRDTVTKVPLLGDIPLLGNLFRRTTKSDTRTELLVLITPYVLLSSEDAVRETKRLHGATKATDQTWHRGWSDSELALEVQKDKLTRRYRTGAVEKPEEVKTSDKVIYRGFQPLPEPDVSHEGVDGKGERFEIAPEIREKIIPPQRDVPAEPRPGTPIDPKPEAETSRAVPVRGYLKGGVRSISEVRATAPVARSAASSVVIPNPEEPVPEAVPAPVRRIVPEEEAAPRPLR